MTRYLNVSYSQLSLSLARARERRLKRIYDLTPGTVRVTYTIYFKRKEGKDFNRSIWYNLSNLILKRKRWTAIWKGEEEENDVYAT